MIRVAAVGDLHAGTDSAGTIRHGFADIGEHADLLLLAGDLTRIGAPQEIDVLIEELSAVTIPKIAVLGNHDHHSDAAHLIRARTTAAGWRMLDGDSTVVEVDGRTVGVAGAKGFGGGFSGASLAAFGELEMKAFARHADASATQLEVALSALHSDWRIALLHYSPVRGTLDGEPREIFPFLGTSRLAEVIDRVGADLVVHGHAHHGTEKGLTPGGIVVRNVAQPVIRTCYRVYCLGAAEFHSDATWENTVP